MKSYARIPSPRLLVIVSLFAVSGVVTLSAMRGSDWPAIQKAATPDTEEIAAIKAVLERSYDVNALAATTFDFSQYDEVYVDDVAVPISVDQAKFVEKVRAERGSAAGGMLHEGFLSFKLAQILDDQRAVEGLERLEATAKAEHHSVTAADLQSISGATGPSRERNNVTPPSSGQQTAFSYKEVAIDVTGRRTEVTYDDGAALAKAFLVKTSEGWKVAGIRAINIHF
ncbi:MAG TPA: hypothetical protein VGE04_09835 [Chloroflexia bacterium]|jgi:hypothetical protein